MAEVHWAAEYIGKPWQVNASGPDAYDCRGLVRQVFRSQRQLEVAPLMPEVANDKQAIVDAAHSTGWNRVGRGVAFAAVQWDIVTMNSLYGLHVGVMIDADGFVKLLHCVGGYGRPGAVILQALQEAQNLGFGRFEFWRQKSV